jgi:hypothetical protein
MNRHDRRKQAAQDRAGKVAPTHAVATEAQLRAAGDALRAVLPGRGWALVTAPAGVDAFDMGNIGQITNMSREHAVTILSGLIDWYRPRGVVVQPDPGTAAALRHTVDMMRRISLEDIAANLPSSGAGLANALNEKRDPKDILGMAMLLATEALAVVDRLMPQVAPKPEGVPMPPAPAPPPRRWPKGNTKETLVVDLEQKPQSETRDRLIAEAKAGRFHDFDSDEVCGKMLLNAELRDAGYLDLAQKVIDGGYDDEHPTLEQQEEMRQELGPKFYDAMMGEKPRGVS